MGGWSGWFKDDAGASVNEKTVERSDGSTDRHTLRDTGGGRNDHAHVVVNHKPDGRSTAHAAPTKSKR